MLEFCNVKLVDYKIKFREAFILKDWKRLRDLAFSLREESYRIGGVELCGRLISLANEVESKQVNVITINFILRNIEDCSEMLAAFLKEHLGISIQSNFKALALEKSANSWHCSIQ